MCEFDPHNDGRRIDPCMVDLIGFLNTHGWKTVACCCGHGVYPMTIVVRTEAGVHMELLRGITLHRRRRFYRRDEHGIYHIPEVRS